MRLSRDGLCARCDRLRPGRGGGCGARVESWVHRLVLDPWPGLELSPVRRGCLMLRRVF